MGKTTTRRHFLRPPKTPEFPEFTGSVDLVRAGRPAMASQFEILFPASERKHLEAVHRALDRVRELERQLTIFDSSSELSKINREASDGPISIQDNLYELLEVSLNLNRETHGSFDITASPIWRCWGFHRRQGRIPSRDEIEEAMQKVGSDCICLNPDEKSIRFLKSGMELNLGSIGKGYALDEALKKLMESGLTRSLLHAGNSSFLAIGDAGAPGSGWRVGIRNPLERNDNLAILRLKDRGMATSGSEEQFFEYEGKRYGHILDPRSGWPVQHHLSATAIAPTAAAADALATAFFILSTESIEQYCSDHPEIGAVVVPTSQDSQQDLEVIFVGEALRCRD